MNYALDANSYPLYIIKSYKNDHVLDINEFNQDAKLFKNVKSNLNRRYNGKPIDLRLISNQVILLTNVFEPLAVARILFFITDKHLHPMVIALTYFRNIYDASKIPEVDLDAKMDTQMLEDLRNLKYN